MEEGLLNQEVTIPGPSPLAVRRWTRGVIIGARQHTAIFVLTIINTVLLFLTISGMTFVTYLSWQLYSKLEGEKFFCFIVKFLDSMCPSTDFNLPGPL